MTVELNVGLHTFQIVGDFSGSGLDAAPTVSIVAVPAMQEQILSREAVIATLLLILAMILLVVDLVRRRLAYSFLDRRPTSNTRLER